jgi:hypothetical protein
MMLPARFILTGHIGIKSALSRIAPVGHRWATISDSCVASPGDELVNSLVNFASSIECRSSVSEHQFMRSCHAK